jgi:parallel beta-helix repeat protein
MSCTEAERNRRHHIRASVERLESRALLSATIVVHPGQSIQSAVDGAPPGSTIRLTPGVYAQCVTIAKPGIHLVGEHGGRGVEIDNPGTADNGITVTSAASGFELDDVTVSGFKSNGVLLIRVNGFAINDVITRDDGEYGLFPIGGSNGVIDGCVASDSADTGIYVGQCAHVVVRNSVAHDNVFGFDIENCTDVLVSGCVSYNNSVGISTTLLPGLPVTTASNIRLIGNLVFDNNHHNFADPEDIASHVPPGIGILLLGVDDSTVAGNIVAGNKFTGVAVGSTVLLAVFAGLPPSIISGIDPNPDNNTIRNNIVLGNGTVPVPGLGAADLLWDGSGSNNHWIDNIFGTSIPSSLP